MINLQPRRRALVKLTYKMMNLCTTYGNYMKKPKGGETIPNVGKQAEQEDLTSNNKSSARCQHSTTRL